jgi:hypothetical protein
MRKRDQDQLGVARGGLIEILQAIQKLRRGGHGQQAGMALGHDHAVLMNGIGGIGRDHRIARSDHREQQVRQRVLGADGDDGFPIRIEVHIVVGLVAQGDLFPQPGDAPGSRIAMVARIPGSLHQLADHHSRRGSVGITHPEIDDILLVRARPRPHFVDDGEYVRGQFLYAVKLFVAFGH